MGPKAMMKEIIRLKRKVNAQAAALKAGHHQHDRALKEAQETVINMRLSETIARKRWELSEQFYKYKKPELLALIAGIEKGNGLALAAAAVTPTAVTLPKRASFEGNRSPHVKTRGFPSQTVRVQRKKRKKVAKS